MFLLVDNSTYAGAAPYWCRIGIKTEEVSFSMRDKQWIPYIRSAHIHFSSSSRAHAHAVDVSECFFDFVSPSLPCSCTLYAPGCISVHEISSIHWVRTPNSEKYFVGIIKWFIFLSVDAHVCACVWTIVACVPARAQNRFVLLSSICVCVRAHEWLIGRRRLSVFSFHIFRHKKAKNELPHVPVANIVAIFSTDHPLSRIKMETNEKKFVKIRTLCVKSVQFRGQAATTYLPLLLLLPFFVRVHRMPWTKNPSSNCHVISNLLPVHVDYRNEWNFNSKRGTEIRSYFIHISMDAAPV